MNQRNRPKNPASKLRPRRKGSPEGPSAIGPPALEAARNTRLIKKARQIIQQDPLEQPDKVAALRRAIEQGEYRIDSRKLANILIAKLILER